MKKILTFLLISVFIFNINAQNQIGGHEYVDLGLSVKWATCNIGASSPMEVGDYYAYGETFTKREYTDENYEVAKTNKRYDAAIVRWGNGWRMPTHEEMKELIERCDWERIEGGFKITGPSGNSIILPDAFEFDTMKKYQRNEDAMRKGIVELGERYYKVLISCYRTNSWDPKTNSSLVLTFSANYNHGGAGLFNLKFSSGAVVRPVHL